IISATNDGRRTKPPPFDSPRRDGSNGGSFVLLPSFVAEIIGETSIKFAKIIIGKSVSVIGIYLSVSVSVLSITEPNRTDRSPRHRLFLTTAALLPLNKNISTKLNHKLLSLRCHLLLPW